MKQLTESLPSVRFGRLDAKMKHLNRLGIALVAGATLLATAARAQTPTLLTSWTNTFDSGSGSPNSTTSWCWWYDLEQQAYYPPGSTNHYGYNVSITNSFDSTMNNTNPPAPTSGPGSGALHWVLPWPGVPAGSGKGGQDLIYGTFAGDSQYDTGTTIDASKYDSISFDVYVGPGSPLDSASNVCVLTPLFFLTSYNEYNIGNVTIGTNNIGKWVRYTVPINKATAPAPGNDPQGLAAGPGFNLNCYGGENASLFTNTVPTVLWIDNIYLKLSTVQAPPPTMVAPGNVLPGLNIISENASDNGQRDQIELQQVSGDGWFGQSGPVTYAFTITNFPTDVKFGYQAHIFITTGPGTAHSLDYNETNLMWLEIQYTGSGAGAAYLRYKVNESNSNTNLFGTNYTGISGLDGSTEYAGTLGGLNASSIVGTWGMTFNNDTNITVFGPGGVSTNYSIVAAAAANFADPLDICFGAQPNSVSQVGEEVVLANVSITNSGTALVFDDFIADNTNTAGLNPEWVINVGEPNTVQLFPNDPAQKVVRWNTPDTGFGLQIASSLNKPTSWTALSGPDATNVTPVFLFSLPPGFRSALVPGADLANTNQAFFRLDGQSFVQLQVLMPGETNAPGTLTGKTGSPTSESLSNGGFTITINACDADWNVITSASDTLQVDSNDSTSSAPVSNPATLTLVQGTTQLFFNFGQTGTWTVTASDTTQVTIKSGTSSPTLSIP